MVLLKGCRVSPLPQGGSSGAASNASASISFEEEELQLRTLRVDVQTLLSPTESQTFRNRAKYAQPVVGGKRERAHPCDSDEADPDAALPISAYLGTSLLPFRTAIHCPCWAECCGWRLPLERALQLL